MSTNKVEAIDLLHRRLTHIAQDGTGDYIKIDSNCSLCSRTPKEYGLAIGVTNAYKQDLVLCTACHSFFCSNVEMLGVEKPKAPDTSQKFGMWSGVGALIEVNTKRTILFAPEGVIKKLPASFPSDISVVKIVSTKQVMWLIENKENLSFPLLWVNDFGRKTDSLIANLALSNSINSVIACTDEILNSTTSLKREIDLSNLQVIADLLSGHKKKAAFLTTVRGLASGGVAPSEAGEFFKQFPELKLALSKMPIDPHARLQMLSIISKII
jgi:hypothetical protein